MKKVLPVVAGLIAIVMIIGCSVSEKSLNDAQSRIDALKIKGVPDSSLSQAKIFLYQARYSKQLGKKSESRVAADSMRKAIASAEENYNNQIAVLRPAVDSMLSIIKVAREEFTGIQRKKFDSTAAKIDSFLQIKWLIQANAKAKEVVDLIPRLKFDQDRAKELKDRIPGEWVCENVTKSAELKDINALEKKTFDFYKDGKARYIESKNGQSGPFLKENWEFDSYGVWDCAGDTIKLSINRFAAIKQEVTKLYIENGKKVWKKEPGPTYDSTITDGSQDRYVTFSDLQEDFKQAKKF